MLNGGGRITFNDGGGETNGSASSPNVPCPLGMFRCNDGKCITTLWVCNYQKDCSEGEDEQQTCRKYTAIKRGHPNKFILLLTICSSPRMRVGSNKLRPLHLQQDLLHSAAFPVRHDRGLRGQIRRGRVQ